ncbi:hypothetical protein [Teredinibacter turnerae]|uniref:hypothetical protein n=1 Tax=Teredinibacter turnerae TaxID=2426 RepID=UPI0030D0AF0A
MGTDINFYIDVDMSKDYGVPSDTPFYTENYINCILGDDIHVGRPYYLFHALANERRRDNRDCLIKPRGFPEKASIEVISKYYFRVVDHDSEIKSAKDILRREAEKIAASSNEHHFRFSKLNKFSGKVYELFSSPYALNCSYLYHNEILESLSYFGIKMEETPRPFQLITAIMASADKVYGDQRSRMVFWFDY